MDAIVVGLGAVGSAAAWQLARRGAKVAGIDCFAPPHARGSSHGDTRITRQAIGEGDAYVPLVLRACELFREVESLTGRELLTVTGGLWISSPARQAHTHVVDFFDNTLRAAKRFGIAHEVLDAAEIRRRFPAFEVREGEVGYHEPAAGYLRPEACVDAQLALARQAGATLHVDERVLALEDRGSHVRVTTDRATHEAQQVVLAAGARVRPLLPADIARRLTITRQLQHWFDVEGPAGRFCPPAFPVFIWELQDRRRVIYGFPAIDGPRDGVKVATEQYEETISDAQLAAGGAPQPARDGEAAALHRDLLAHTLPGLAPRCLRSVACLYTATADFQFVVDRLPASPRVILASACSGHGFKHSAAVGEALAQMALGEPTTVDLSAFALRN